MNQENALVDHGSGSSMACIFCRIATGEAPSRTVYEDGTTMAFLDANPLARGHTLVIPRDHYQRLNDLPTEEAEDVLRVLHGLVDPVESAVDADATTVAFNNGRAAGQEVPHVHGHIVPRFRDDRGGPIHRLFGDRPSLSDGELDRICDQITQHVHD